MNNIENRNGQEIEKCPDLIRERDSIDFKGGGPLGGRTMCHTIWCFAKDNLWSLLRGKTG